jgi:hypothetical protein
VSSERSASIRSKVRGDMGAAKRVAAPSRKRHVVD